nr:MAG TPA: hypothetical protein [Caudoviricetes sp.]
MCALRKQYTLLKKQNQVFFEKNMLNEETFCAIIRSQERR